MPVIIPRDAVFTTIWTIVLHRAIPRARAAFSDNRQAQPESFSSVVRRMNRDPNLHPSASPQENTEKLLKRNTMSARPIGYTPDHGRDAIRYSPQ